MHLSITLSIHFFATTIESHLKHIPGFWACLCIPDIYYCMSDESAEHESPGLKIGRSKIMKSKPKGKWAQARFLE